MSSNGYRGDIFDIKRFAIHDGPGIRTTVFFRGCPLLCWWCHNPEARVDCGAETYRKRSIDLTLPVSDNVIGPSVRLETLVGEVARDRIFYEQSDGGVTASGGEPMMQIEFLEGLLESCREMGIKTVVDTSGYAPWSEFERIRGLVDLFMVDLKLFDDSLHEKFTGVSNGLILENFEKLIAQGSAVRARLPMIPGITDTDKNIDALISYLGRFPDLELVSLLPYNRLGEDKFERLGVNYTPGRLKAQTPGEMRDIADRFEGAGLSVRIGG
jgi:pyruvate formate lyase activating enzyme